MSLDRDFGRNFDSTVTSVHNPWVSDVVPPIKQNLLFLNFQKMSRQRYEMQKFCLLRLKIDRE